MKGFILLIVLAGSYAAGYFVRDYMSRRRRAEARRQIHLSDAPDPANSNNIVPKVVPGELGQMLDRWEGRARERRAGQFRTGT